MDSRMIFERLFDKELIMGILMDPDLLKTTAIDDKVTIEIDAGKMCFLGCYIEEELAGVAVFEPDNSVCIDYHPNLLNKFRGKNSLGFTVGALKWIHNNAEQYVKVNAKFPAIHKHLKRYAENCGFTFEGVDRNSCPQGDRYCYGITRKEIGQL